ncbi:MAG: DUF3750 domain-containing protein [Casimicrobiaceae bacterium]
MTIGNSALRAVGWLVVAVVLMLCGPLLTLAFGSVSMHGDWRTATHRPTGLAPNPAAHPEAIVQVYASRTFGWRGAFAVHTWVAAKPAYADHYTRYEVIGWYARGGGSGITISDDEAPDAEWYGRTPRLIADVSGPRAETAIAKLAKVVADYSYTSYRAWPGPNSNTFIAYVGRAIPELNLTMPSLAIGKDYLPGGQWFSPTPSGTGYQLSLDGIIGVTAARDEGFEINLFGLVTGIDFRHPALKFPGIGRIPGGA